MVPKVARINSSSLIPIVGLQILVFAIGVLPSGVFAGTKERETIELQITSSHTKIHRSSAGGTFTYTDLIVAQVNGKQLTYECEQRGDVCPLMESGKTYTAEREGDIIYISMNLPDAEKPLTVRYRESAGQKSRAAPVSGGRSLP